MTDLSKEIGEARTRAAAIKADEARLRGEADALVAGIKESGVDILTDKDAFAKVDAAYAEADRLRDDHSEVLQRYARLMEITGEKADSGKNDIQTREAQHVAERLISSPEIARLREAGAFKAGSAHRIALDPVEAYTREDAMGMLNPRLRTVTNASGSGGGVIWSDRLQNMIVDIPQRPVRLLDIVTLATTDSDTIEWTLETTHTDAAAETAFGTAAPVADYGFTKQTTTVKRLPVQLTATRGALADSGQLRALLDSRLESSVKRRIERQIYVGDNTGENLFGITDSARSLPTQALSTDTRWDAVHKAITKIRIGMEDEAEARHMVIHPNDFEQIVLETDDVGNYLNQRGPVEPGTIWGLIPVVSTLATEGTILVGAFERSYVFMREGISLSASSEHDLNFTKGLITLLAETRLAHIVDNVSAFCTVTGV